MPQKDLAQIRYPYAKQSINDEDRQAVHQVLLQDKITRGIKTQEFEEKVASWCGAKFAVSFNSATSALFAAYFAAQFSSQDRLISTANTFIASVSPALMHNVRPEFCDLEKNSPNLDLDNLRELLKETRSRGRTFIVPVHFAGIAIDMKKLERQIASENIVIIEDAAHALGSSYPTGEKVGSCTYSNMTVFSFHPAKNMTTGEGGMVTTNCDALYERLLRYRNNGIIRQKPLLKEAENPGYYEIHELGGNFHMTEMQAALGLSQFSRLEQFVEKRKMLVRRYRQNFATENKISLFSEAFDERSAYHLMLVKIDFARLKKERTRLMKKLSEKGIGTEVHYIPLYHHTVLSKYFKNNYSLYPETELYYEQTLSLPLYYDLELLDVDAICAIFKELIST